MIGAAIIVVVLLVVIPVGVLMSTSLIPWAIGRALRTDADARNEGSELIDLNS